MAKDHLDYQGRVVIITGAGNGLGKSHALLFAARGAKVVVNDLGGKHDGTGKGSAAADAVVKEIKDLGGEAVANHDSVEDGQKIVQTAMDAFGRVDVVVNNAGILRDTSFPKMTQEDWDLVYRVHVLGSYRVTHAAWNVTGGMRDKGYGRIIFTSSAAGIYGNFGQANYSTAKLGVVGLMQTLAIEGRKRNILVNAIAPIAGSRMTETVFPANLVEALKPEFVSPLVVWLCHESCKESGGLFEVGGGFLAKLRWERAQGKTFKLGRVISPEDVSHSFADITSFAHTTHPFDVASSMQPILANLDTKSRGGNEFIDVDAALDAPPYKTESQYDERDVALYALGVGAAENPLDPRDLSLVYEMNGEGFYTLPTFAVIPSMKVIFEQFKKGAKAPGLNYGFERVLHGEQYTEIKRPLPPRAKLRHEVSIKDIYDKGKNALVITAIKTFDEDGEELAYNELSTIVRGAGGYGGERGPASDLNVPPARSPDVVFEEKTHPNQALLYRLSGDINPLHADPLFAQGFGFDKPILHGLCTFGFAARAVIKSFKNNDPRYFKSIKVRFAESVFPGETLVTEMWKESEDRIIFRTKVKERDKVVISNAAVEFYREIPKPRPKAATTDAVTAASGPAPASTNPISADVFTGIKSYFAANADAVKKIGVVYHFKLTSPDSLWTLDTKTAEVTAGGATPAQCTLELSDSDFMAMCSGKADPMKLFMDKKLRITGDLMASQKLEFLKKIDPASVLAAARARSGGSASTATAAAALEVADRAQAGASGEAKSAAKQSAHATAIFTALKKRLAENNQLAAAVGAVLTFVVDGKAWTVDLKNGPGAVIEGSDSQAAAVFTLADADLLALIKGTRTAQDLYQHGLLRVDGDIRYAHKLALFVDLV